MLNFIRFEFNDASLANCNEEVILALTLNKNSLHEEATQMIMPGIFEENIRTWTKTIELLWLGGKKLHNTTN